MKVKNLILGLSFFVLMSLTSGCAPFLIGGTLGAVGGYAVSKDTIQGEIDKSYDAVWDAAVEVCKILGDIELKDKLKGIMEVKIDKSRVKISLDRLTPSTVRLQVSARKYLMPNIGLAQKVFIKIIEQAK